MGVAKARIILYEGNEVKYDMYVQFNPESYKITTQGKTSSKKDLKRGAATQATDHCTQTLTINLLFDTYEEKISVREYTDKLVDIVSSYQKIDESRSVPNCKFIWGTITFRGYIKTITENFTMFLPNGIPVRAKVDMTIESDQVMISEKEKEEKERTRNIEVNLSECNLFGDEDNPRL